MSQPQLDLTNPEHQDYHLHQEVGLPAFFETVHKRAGWLPSTAEGQDRLFAVGMRLLDEHYKKQAAAPAGLDAALSKAGSALGLTAAQPEPPNVDRYIKSVLDDAAVKQAFVGLYRRHAG